VGIPLRILIVDDSSTDAELVLQELRSGGFEPSFRRVDTEATLSAALDTNEWDIIVVDNGIPQFSGLEALRLAREKNPDIPLIMLSSRAGEVAAVEAMKAGAHDYIMKDNLGRLVAAVGRELQESEERRERRRAEQALEEHAHFMRVLLDAIPTPIFYKDTIGMFLGCNKAFEAVMGIPREQIIGRTFFDIVPRYLAEQYASSDGELLREQGLEISEGMIVNADGVTLDVIFYKATFGSLDGTLGGLVGTILDITERKRMEQQLWYVSMHDGLTGFVKPGVFRGGDRPSGARQEFSRQRHHGGCGQAQGDQRHPRPRRRRQGAQPGRTGASFGLPLGRRGGADRRRRIRRVAPQCCRRCRAGSDPADQDGDRGDERHGG